MANLRKFSDMKSIGHLCAHYERSVQNDNYSNPDIDKTKLKLDRTNFAPDRDMKQTEYLKKLMNEVYQEKNMRRDAVRMCCWVVDAPKNLPEEKNTLFFQEVYKFLNDRYGGEKYCISAYVHLSETTPHMHYAFAPVKDNNGVRSFCAKEIVGREDLKTFHQDLGKYLEQKGICKKSDILNGKTKRDASGRALSVKQLKKERAITRERTVNRWATTPIEYERNRGRW